MLQSQAQPQQAQWTMGSDSSVQAQKRTETITNHHPTSSNHQSQSDSAIYVYIDMCIYIYVCILYNSFDTCCIVLHHFAVVFNFSVPKNGEERLASRAGHSLPAGLWPPAEWHAAFDFIHGRWRTWIWAIGVLSAAERHLELSTSNAASHPAHAAPSAERAAAPSWDNDG